MHIDDELDDGGVGHSRLHLDGDNVQIESLTGLRRRLHVDGDGELDFDSVRQISSMVRCNMVQRSTCAWLCWITSLLICLTNADSDGV